MPSRTAPKVLSSVGRLPDEGSVKSVEVDARGDMMIRRDTVSQRHSGLLHYVAEGWTEGIDARP